ncbi:MAG: phosphonate C-P lyase system protein PhnH [Deltaproteobacteria bacterium]|nr:phosphonate C-P lyase system protein PhnH [Deltaproteobacteria bacterium]
MGACPGGKTTPGRILPGFGNPVFDSQSVFRAALSAFASPAVRLKAPFGGLLGNAREDASLPLALALALCDNRTGVWLSATYQDLWPYVSFHTGAANASPGLASFLLAASVSELPRLEGLSLGTEARPDLSATIFLRLGGVGGGRFEARGPGIETAVILEGIGLEAPFAEEREALSGLYPQGLDMFLCLGDELVGLPRTTRLRAI